MNDVLFQWDIDQGIATLEKDPWNPEGLLLNINGTHSSYIDPDPLAVEFEYMQWMVAAIEHVWQQPDRLSLLHLGGAACTMARWASARYKAAHNLVIEYDGKLATVVREHLDLPRTPKLRIRVGDAAEEIHKIHQGSRDIIIRDVFVDGATPQLFTTVEYAQAVKRVLTGDGMYLINCGDSPNLWFSRQEAATLSSVFENVYMLSDASMLKGRRIGNIVFVCTSRELDIDVVRRSLLVQAANIQGWGPTKVKKFGSSTQPLSASQLELKLTD